MPTKKATYDHWWSFWSTGMILHFISTTNLLVESYKINWHHWALYIILDYQKTSVEGTHCSQNISRYWALKNKEIYTTFVSGTQDNAHLSHCKAIQKNFRSIKNYIAKWVMQRNGENIHDKQFKIYFYKASTCFSLQL